MERPRPATRCRHRARQRHPSPPHAIAATSAPLRVAFTASSITALVRPTRHAPHSLRLSVGIEPAKPSPGPRSRRSPAWLASRSLPAFLAPGPARSGRFWWSVDDIRHRAGVEIVKPTPAGFMREGPRCPMQHRPERRARPRSSDRGPFSMASRALQPRRRHPSRFGPHGPEASQTGNPVPRRERAFPFAS